MNPIYKDFPKLEAPFTREQGIFLPELKDEYNWVMMGLPSPVAVEKLNGTNVSVIIRGGSLIGYTNREQFFPPNFFDNSALAEGIRNAMKKSWIPMEDGQHFGEVMGPSLQKNPLDLQEHLWFPFDMLLKDEKYHYKEWNTDKFTGLSEEEMLEALSDFMLELPSRARAKYVGDQQYAEGIVFYWANGASCKVRRDMFSWYKGKKHKQ